MFVNTRKVLRGMAFSPTNHGLMTEYGYMKVKHLHKSLRSHWLLSTKPLRTLEVFRGPPATFLKLLQSCTTF